MSKYSTITTSNGFVRGTAIKDSNGKYFAGYDFMGSVKWKDSTYDIVIVDDDEAQQIIRDLEATDEPEEDPVIKSLQTTMDYAWNRREDEYNALEHIRENGPEFMLHKQYAEYRASQAFYEGICMAIFAAGYQIRIDNHETGKSTVCK